MFSRLQHERKPNSFPVIQERTEAATLASHHGRSEARRWSQESILFL